MLTLRPNSPLMKAHLNSLDLEIVDQNMKLLLFSMFIEQA